MTVRDELIDMGWYYYSPGEPCEEWADAIIAKIAHELAERIRNENFAYSSHEFFDGLSAADLIDPEVNDA